MYDVGTERVTERAFDRLCCPCMPPPVLSPTLSPTLGPRYRPRYRLWQVVSRQFQQLTTTEQLDAELAALRQQPVQGLPAEQQPIQGTDANLQDLAKAPWVPKREALEVGGVSE